jgi:hypothetical protein
MVVMNEAQVFLMDRPLLMQSASAWHAQVSVSTLVCSTLELQAAFPS